MKIAVSAKGTSVDSEVDPRFGRTIGFILAEVALDKICQLHERKAVNPFFHSFIIQVT